jgi:hypothetical protein
MEPQQDRIKKYAESLEKTVENTYHYLEKTVDDFKEKCLLVSPERALPRDIILDIREGYKDIREKIGEVKSIQQLLKGKYRQHVRPNPTRDKAILELGFLAKTCYSRFEYTLMQIQAKERAKLLERLKEKQRSSEKKQAVSLAWFHSRENQTFFVEGLALLKESAPEVPPASGEGDRREGSLDASQGRQSLTLFVIRGDPLSLDELQPKMQLRERDILERCSKEELRGVLTHLRAVDPAEIESILQRFMTGSRFSDLKCLLLRMESQKHLGNHLFDFIEKMFEEMVEGEVRTVSI